MIPEKLQKKLQQRLQDDSLRTLGVGSVGIDFSSNDYLGFSKSEVIFNRASEILKQHRLEINGATGSRLLSGNHILYDIVEPQIAAFHNTEDALIFNSGYDANVGFFSSVPQRGDIIFYDELCHASIRDGIKMSDAKAYKFKHNNIEDFKKALLHFSLLEGEMSGRQRGFTIDQNIYVVTESVFSMDGDKPDLKALVALCKQYNCYLIVDEAHAVGVLGANGEGLVQQLGLEKDIFARLVTFGKALGCHGAAILASKQLRKYLINFSRSFIYTTALPPHMLASIGAAYETLLEDNSGVSFIKSNIAILHKHIKLKGLEKYFFYSESAIQSCVISGNERVKKISEVLKTKDFNVKAILSPTVPKGKERLRICLHSYNMHVEIEQLIAVLAKEIH